MTAVFLSSGNFHFKYNLFAFFRFFLKGFNFSFKLKKLYDDNDLKLNFKNSSTSGFKTYVYSTGDIY